MQAMIMAVTMLVMQLITGNHPLHVQIWARFLLPLRDQLNILYPSDKYAAAMEEIPPPVPSGHVQP